MKKILISILSLLLLVSCTWKDNNKSPDIVNSTWNTIDKAQDQDTNLNNSWTQEVQLTNYVGPDWQPLTDVNTKIDVPALYKLLNEWKQKELEQELNKVDSEDRDVLKIYSKLYLLQKKYNESLEKALKADLKFSWKDADLNFQIGVIYDNLWKKVEAKKYIEKSLEINPKFIQAKEYIEILKASMTGSIEVANGTN